MSFVETCIRRPVTVMVCVILVVVFGLVGLLRVPVQLTPNVDQPVINVSTNWIGADPQEVEREIIEEQEEVLRSVSGLRNLVSTASPGSASIRMEFAVGVNRTEALNEVRDKLRQVPAYPPEVDEPIVEAVDSASSEFIAWVMLRPREGATQTPSGEFRGDITELNNYAEDYIKPALLRAEGVAEVNVLGGKERELQVRLDLEALAARGLTVDRVAAALRSQNANVSAGTVDEGKRRASIRAVGRYERVEDVENTVIAFSAGGTPVYVRDVAEVKLDFKRQQGFVRSRGTPVLAINALRQTGTNVLVVMENLQRAVAEVNDRLPQEWGLELWQTYDQTIYVRQAVESARDDLLIGAVLATVVLFLTLRSVGATVVVAVSIPVSLIGTLLGMALTGRNLNVISMAGLAFAIGMGVDNTIVVLENIFRHREMGKDRIQAAIDGTQEVWGAIVAATLANIAVFLPVVFIQEEAGQLFRDISVAISISLALYMVLSPTMIPVLATVLLRKVPRSMSVSSEGDGSGDGGGDGGERGAGSGWMEAGSDAIAPAPRGRSRLAGVSYGFYRLVHMLTGGLAVRAVVVVGMIGASLAGAWYLMPDRDYLPGGNQNLVFSFVNVPPGYSLDELNRIGATIEGRVRPWWEAKPGSPELAELQRKWKANATENVLPRLRRQLEGMRAAMPAADFAAASRRVLDEIALYEGQPPPALSQFFFVARGGGVFMGAISADPDNVQSVTLLFSDAAQAVPGISAFARQIPLFRLDRQLGGISVNVSGPDYERVIDLTTRVRGMLQAEFGFVRADPANFDQGAPEIRVKADLERAGAARVDPASLRLLARVAVDGAYVGDYRVFGRAVDLMLMSRQSGTDFTEYLAAVPMATTDGRIVPLGAVAEFARSTAPQSIVRIQEQPSVTLAVNLPAGVTVEEAVRRINNNVLAPLRQQGAIPVGYAVGTSGAADRLSQFNAAILPGFLLAVLIAYLLLAALFESWIHPLTIIMSVPFALVGGFAALQGMILAGAPVKLDTLTMLGFVILVGTIVNNPILIVHQALNYIREGLPRRHAIALSTQTRVRPIFMSVVVSVAGMAPLVLLGGAGSELYRGLGAVVVGGLLVSTVFTLLLTPTLMSLLLDLQTGLWRLLGRRGDVMAGPVESKA
jgi:hydrophobic/amphiphilic exporter-1 (mainly G- bacteria), HAE1 family